MRLLSRMLLIAVAVAGVGMATPRADASHFTARIYDQDRHLYDLYSYQWYLQDGTRDAYDGFAYASINGSTFRPSSSPYKYFEYSNRGIRSSNNPRFGCFGVQSRLWVPSSGNINSRNYGRMIWNIRNHCGSTQNLNFRIYGNLGSDSSTVITNTSDGDTTFETTDHWLATDDSSNGNGDPSLAFVFGNGTGEQPSSVSQSRDNLSWNWNGVSVAANQTKTFMFFNIQDRNRDASHNEARRVVTLPDEVMANLTTAERLQLINFGMGASVRNVAVTVSENSTPAIRATWELSGRATARAELFENSTVPEGQTACTGGSRVATENLGANTRFSFTWANRANWNVLKRGTSYCVKVTATDGGNVNVSRSVNLVTAIASVASSIDQYAPSIRATASFNANPAAAAYIDLFATSNCSGTRVARSVVGWNEVTKTVNYSGAQVRRNTAYCVKVTNGYASRNFSLGTVTAEPRNYPDSLVHILGVLRAIDGGGEDFEDDLDDAIGHVSTAKAYWDATTEAGNNSDFNAVQMNWGPSLRRAVSAIRAMGSARRNDAPGTLRTHEADLAAAMRQEVKVFVRDTISTRASADGAPGYWTAIRDVASAAIDSAADQAAGQPKAVASANAYDKLATMYDSRYSAENRISVAQIALNDAIDEDVGDRPLDELTAALHSVVRYGLKLEIKLARDTNAAGRDQLDLVLTSITTVAGCLAGLQSNSLNDHDFTECYQEVIIILKKLKEVQGALVDTSTWQGLLGIGVYAMLDISIYHTENSLVTREGVDEDEEAQEGILQHRAGLAEIRAGNATTAIQRYINNECRIIDLYNRYWAGPGNAVIDNTDACARVCGNSQVEEGEQCDDGNFTDTDGCTTNCQLNVCGDGSLYSGREACDDGNRINTDSCTNVCAVARCGDTVVRVGSEECDDGNLVNDDNCSNECVAARCGDSVRQGAEECDDGDQNNANTCSNTCTLNAAKIATGYYHTCFLRSGNVYCSGYNPYGQLGDGSSTQRTSSVQVRNLTNVKAIAAGLYHTCAVKTDGTAWCWGYGGHGQLGNGSTSIRNTPVQVRGLTGITQIAAGHIHTCARKSNGTLFCWGYNYYGQNGAGNYTNTHSSPVQVSGISNAKSVTLGIFHTCATLTTGAVKCWGYGDYHQTTNTSSRPSRTASPRTISGMSGITAVEASGYGNCALRSNGTVACWGYGCHGQMGDARTSCYNYGNLTVQNLTGAAEIGGGYYHMCGRQSDGAVKCWGMNNYGQIGDGSTTNRNTAVAVRGITDAVAISHGSQAWHSCASRRDGSVACWGNGGQGQLGVGSTSNSTTPVNVVGAAGGDIGVGNSATNPGRSCKQIKTARATANQRASNGSYFIDPNGGSNTDSKSVYCDMTTDGGGWTQVANTVNYTLNDQGGSYYSDIASKVPSGQHYTIWNGMRAYVSGNADVRFTCKLNKNSAAHNVDLSFYNIHWYTEITTGSDASSCFEENNGQRDTQPTPARKNNLNNQSLARGNNWAYGYLEGEDSCGDTGDFTVDFDDRGMDANQTDGTDWGEDDGSKKCGSSYGGSNASWQIWVRERAVNVGGGGGGGGGGSCGGWSWNGGCWYTASQVGQTCNQVCSTRGGFNAGTSRHTGNQVGRHFWAQKRSGGNWVGIECSSTDNNTNWGANGSAPDGNWRHSACYVNCACNR